MKPVIYVVVNKALNMSPGKTAAQVGHAVAGLKRDPHRWLSHPHRWMIVLEAKNGEQLYHLTTYLHERGVNYYAVVDEGVNEIPAFSLTAVSVGILDKDSTEATYLSGFSKYQYVVPGRSKERTEIWNEAVRYMQSKPWHKRLFNKT